MRILNIAFKNINSLEGEGLLHFDHGPIADSGVFAITGPNGSGKSSILDVITLGLYGETFRFDRPANHVMTKHTQECYAQVEFALGTDRFRARWEVKRDASLSDSAPLAARMSLSKIGAPDETLAETPNQVRTRIAELTGMDFHRFSKTIVLPQGDFAAFLHALDSERMDILEKISGTNLAREYLQQLEDRFGQSQTRLAELKQDMAGIPLLEPEALQAAAADLEDFQLQVGELQQQKRQAQADLETLHHLAYQRQTVQQLQSQQQELAQKIQQYQSELQRIASHQAALQFKPDLSLLRNKEAQAAQQQTALESLRKELGMLQQQLGDGEQAPPAVDDQSLAEQRQILDGLKLSVSELKLELPRQRELVQSIQQQIAGHQDAVAELDAWLQAHQAEAVLLEDFPDVVLLRKLRTERAELEGKQKSQTAWTKNTQSALKKNQTALADTEAAIADLTARIEQDKQSLQTIAHGKSLDELTELQQEQQARVADLQEMLSLANATDKLTGKGLLVWLGLKKPLDVPPDINELQAKLDELTQAMNREQNIAQVLENALRSEALVKKLTADRAKLIDGQPCYLCGSTEHPYVAKPPVFTDAKQALADQRGKIQTLKAGLDSANSQLNAAKKFDTQQSNKQQRLQQMHSQWTVLANRLNVMRGEMAIGNLSLQKHYLLEETEELNKLNGLVKQYGQLQRNLGKMQAELESKRLGLQKQQQAVQTLTAQWENRPPEFDQVAQRYNECLSQENALIQKLTAQLAALGEKLPAKGKENALFDRLTARRQDYQVYLLRRQGQQKEIDELQARLQSSQDKIRIYEQQLAEKQTSLSEQERLSLHLAIIEKQKLIIDQEQSLRVLQIECKTILQSLTDKLAANPVAQSLDELADLLQLIESEPQIRQQLTGDENRLADIERQLQTLQDNLQTESAACSALDEEQLARQLAGFTAQLDIAEQEVQTLQHKLAKQQQYRDKLATLENELAEQQQLFNAAEAELAQIKADPAGYKRNIQRMLVNNLLSHANRILEQLSGRYSIRNAGSELGLALEIEDLKQNNVRRQPQTLSGGESFVVSLALALALAEIANNGKAIDSLFLDEGFGNLDAESLYLAMSTLESLKTHGKTVGIISHVEGVKKRIKTQIELVKKPNGLSELKMVA